MVGADISPVVVHAKHSEKIREIFQIISLVSIQLETVSPILNDTNLSKRLKWERDREKRSQKQNYHAMRSEALYLSHIRWLFM